MDGVTLVLVVAYAGALLALAYGRRVGGGVEYLLAGRRLTLPAFVATLVTTWYGGILGIGEYAWSFGISTWVVFGVPYYLAALLFGLWLASRLRRSDAISIPDLLDTGYGRGAALTGATAIYAATIPVAYLLMVTTLLSRITGWSPLVSTAVAAAFSVVYVGLSGFRSVVRTDILQFVLMYGGFLILLPFALHHTGGFSGLWADLPATHRTWDGGLDWQTVLVWYLIALQTIVEPSFYQRVFAARSPRIARKGILVSVLLWMIFDFLSTFSGLAARVLLPDLQDPMLSYPALAEHVLPPVLAAVFTVGLFAIVMSTLDSYLFLAASTVGHDLVGTRPTAAGERRRTRWGLVVSAALAAAGALLFDSVVQVWHHVGSVVTSALLLPVVALYMPARIRMSQPTAITAMILAAAIATAWIAAGDETGYPLGMEPMFPALAAAALCWLADLGLGRCRAERPGRPLGQAGGNDR